MAFFYMIRHGSTAANNPKAEVLRGWEPWPLSDKGMRQARDAGRFLQDKGITRIVYSDLRRVKQTTEEANKFIKCDNAKPWSAIRDWDTGAMAGMMVEAMKPLLDFFQRHPSYALPLGEPYGDFWGRWKSTFKELCDFAVKNPQERLAVFTHARNIVTVQHLAKGRGIGPVSYDDVPQPGGVMRVDIKPNGSFSIHQVYGELQKGPRA